MKLTVNTPEGTRDRLFAECMGRRQVQERLIRLFRQRGYREVSTPETEFYDLFARSGSAIPQEQMVQVFDQSGKLCVMRPDSTTPSPGWRPQSFGPCPCPSGCTTTRPCTGPAGPQRREPGAPPVRGGADRSRRDESGSGDGGHSSGRPAGVPGPHGSMWSWATPASSGMWPPGWSWRRGDGADAGPDRGQKLRRPAGYARPLPGEPRQRGPCCASPGCSAGRRCWMRRRRWPGRRRRWSTSEPCTGNCPRRDTARWSALTWGWSTRSTTILAWSSGAMWREQGMRCCLADATTRWWGYSAGRPRPPALP